MSVFRLSYHSRLLDVVGANSETLLSSISFPLFRLIKTLSKHNGRSFLIKDQELFASSSRLTGPKTKPVCFTGFHSHTFLKFTYAQR